MTNAWTESLEKIRVILFDYSAIFEVGHSSSFKSLTETIIERRIEVVLCSSFNYYHTCMYRAENNNESSLLSQTVEFLEILSHEGLLQVDAKTMSLFSVLPKFAGRKDVCLFAAKNSTVLDQILTSKFSGDTSVCLFYKETSVLYQDLSTFLDSYKPITVNPIATSSDYLDVAIYVNIGDYVYTETGESILLSEKISTGSEGLVFRTHDPDKVAKIYHRGVMTALRWMKLTRMTKMGLRAKGICWPTSLLYNRNHEPVGYLMPVAAGFTLGSVFDGEDAILERFPDWDRSSVVQAACQIFEKIVYLHIHGILIGDIQLKNIMIKSASEVYIIDIDSVQLEDLPCPVGTEEFTPPELWDRSFNSFLRGSLQEDYSCGILAFSLLFCGQHPYNQRHGKETLREEIESYCFPYDFECGDNVRVPVGGYDKIWLATPTRLQKMFYSAFSEGKLFETVEWYAALDSYKDQLSSMAFPDPQAYMLFPHINRTIPPGIQAERNVCKTRSIRDAIIHVPERQAVRADISCDTPDRVMYNGRPIGVAFVNQDKLNELEIGKYSRQDAPAAYPSADPAPGYTSRQAQTTARPIPTVPNPISSKATSIPTITNPVPAAIIQKTPAAAQIPAAARTKPNTVNVSAQSASPTEYKSASLLELRLNKTKSLPKKTVQKEKYFTALLALLLLALTLLAVMLITSII